MSKKPPTPHKVNLLRRNRGAEVPMTTIRRYARAVVKRFQPERIILFGSHARGEAGPDSDVDLLVVMPVRGSVRDTRLAIRAALHGVPVPVDVVVTTPEDFAWRREVVSTIEWSAAREGKVLYAQC